METTYLYRGWEFVQRSKADKGEWLEAQVPGHVHLDLVRHGVIAHPFERMHEAGAQWVDAEDWSYRCRFVWSPKPGLPRRVLRFEGLDTIAHVSVNGERVAISENMHVPLEVDVTETLREGENEVRVDFLSAVRIGNERMAEYLAEQSLPNDVARFEERSFVRKAQYMFGWDWGPRLVSCGIWKPVSLVEYAARLTDVWIRQRHHDNGSVALTIVTEVEGDAKVSMVVEAPDGEETKVPPAGKLTIKEPYLWWTHDLGEPHLYSLHVTLEGTDGASQTVTKRFGLREIRLVQEPDEHGSSFQFELNGFPIYARGANWIPDHSFPSAITGQQIHDQFARMVDMNMNMVRVWGGGLYESDAFYDFADETGVLVWQDFAYGCAYYPDTGAWQEIAREETASNVKRLRNHASLALWCGNNENLTMWHSAWGGKEHQPPRYYGEHLYDGVIPAVLKELDPERDYIPSSPYGGEHANQGGVGDQHCWDVWHGGDWRKYTASTARFCSEFGFSASPSADVWQETLGEDDLDPRSPVVRWHDKTGKSPDEYHGLVHLHYPEIETLEDLVFYSQLNQRDALRFGIEHYRRSEFCKGTLIWQLNDCWPVQSWAVVDARGNYKAAAFELRRLYAPTLVSIERDGEIARVHCVNDSGDPVKDELMVRAVSLVTGERLGEWKKTASLEPGKRRVVLEVPLKGLNTSETVLVAAWGEADAWQLLAEPKHARLGEFDIYATVNGDEGLAIHAEGPVLDLMLGGYDWDHGLADGGPIQGPGTQIVLSLPEGGVYELGYVKPPKSLIGRSLAGLHEIPVYRSPI